MSNDTDFFLSVLTTQRKPAGTFSIPVWVGAARISTVNDKQYQVIFEDKVDEDLHEQQILANGDSFFPVRLLPSSAGTKGRAFPAEIEDPSKLNSRLFQIYKMQSWDVYKFADWEYAQQLQYSKVQSQLQRFSQQANPIGIIVQALQTVEYWNAFWNQFSTFEDLATVPNAPKVDNNGEPLTPDSLKTVKADWAEAETEMYKLATFAYDRQLVAAVSNEETEIKQKVAYVSLIGAALKISDTRVFEAMTIDQVYRVLVKIMEIANVSDGALPEPPPENSDSDSEEPEKKEPSTATSGKKQKRGSPPTSESPNDSSAQEKSPSQSVNEAPSTN